MKLVSRGRRWLRKHLWGVTRGSRARFKGILVGPENFCCRAGVAVEVAVDAGVGRRPTFAPWLQRAHGSFVVLCDPTPKHMAGLREWVSSNGNAVLVEAAVADATGMALFYESEAEESGSLDDTHTNVGRRGCYVQVHTLSIRDLLATASEYGPVGLVKLDLEGAEFDSLTSCLKEAPHTLLSVPQWLVEFHPFPQTAHSMHDIARICLGFRQLGFKGFSPNGIDHLFWTEAGRA